MGKTVHADVLNAALTELATSTSLHVVSDTSTPTGITNSLANVTIDSGDFTQAAGDVNGRKVTIAQQADVEILVTGTAKHVLCYDGTNVMLVTTCDDLSLTDGNYVTFPAFDYEINLPT